jgi:5-hydroxyisourate hydrolase
VGGGALLAVGTTDSDGRVRDLGPDHLDPGDYRLEFDVATPFLPRVIIEFRIADDRHYHVPVLLSPYGFTTYRGS